MIFHTYATTEEEVPQLDYQKILPQQCNVVYRCEFERAKELMPHLAPILDTAPPKNRQNWEVDIKVHMLMKGQYPCIPNWHCDYVPRVDGKTNYNAIKDNPSHAMFLFMSGEPLTEFLADPYCTDSEITSHSDLSKMLNKLVYHEDERFRIETQKAPQGKWIGFDNRTPHRSRICKENTWRLFIRLVNKKMTQFDQNLLKFVDTVKSTWMQVHFHGS